MSPRRVALVLALAAASAAPRAAVAAEPADNQTADEQAELDKARAAYRAQQYEEADARFVRLLDPKTGLLHDKILIKQARMYWAATLIALGHPEDASLLFEQILTDDRDYEPDPLAFPTKVTDAFIDTRTRLREKLEAIRNEQYRKLAERRAEEEAEKKRQAERVKLLERLAGEAYVTKKHSRAIALLPFGVGQFQNGQQGLGWTFLTLEGLFLGGALATLPFYYVDLHDAASTYDATKLIAQEQANAYYDRANTARYVNLALNGAFAATAVIGIIQAEAAFVPETTVTTPRKVPDMPDATPSAPSHSFVPKMTFGAAPVAGRDGRGVSGGVLGLRLTF